LIFSTKNYIYKVYYKYLPIGKFIGVVFTLFKILKKSSSKRKSRIAIVTIFIRYKVNSIVQETTLFVSLIASKLLLRRATKVDPTNVLREE